MKFKKENKYDSFKQFLKVKHILIILCYNMLITYSYLPCLYLHNVILGEKKDSKKFLKVSSLSLHTEVSIPYVPFTNNIMSRSTVLF